MILTAIYCLLVTYLSIISAKNLLHPAVVYSSLWSAQLIGLLIAGDKFFEPSSQALGMISVGLTTFVMGALIPTLTDSAKRSSWIQLRTVRPGYWLFVAAAAITAICLKGQYEVFVGYWAGDFAATLVHTRILMSIDNEDVYGVYKYGSSVATAALLLLEILVVRRQASPIHMLLLGFFVFAALMMAVLSTGRGPIVFVLLLMGIIYFLRAKITLRAWLLITCLTGMAFSVFWVMGSAMGKADEDASGAVGDLALYLFSSIPALSVYLEQTRDETYALGINTFRFIVAIFAAMGLAPPPPSLVQEFVSVPNSTNLYTTYLQYFQDFGMAGVMVFPFALGFLHSKIFYSALSTSTNDYGLYLLAVSYLPLIQTVFQETHFSSLSLWIQMGLIGFILTKRQILQRVNVP